MATAPATSKTVVGKPRHPPRIRWHRSPVDREQLAILNQRSDLRGALQTGGFLGLLAANTGLAAWSALHWPWPVTLALVLWHGTCWQFLVNGFHELVHRSVFRTRGFNEVFVRIFGFLGWHNHHFFRASHEAHHKYTLHEPDDLEVVLPVKITLAGYLGRAVVDLPGFAHMLRGQVRRSLGDWNPDRDPWTAQLFPAADPESRRCLVNWARTLLLGHGLIVVASLATGWWIVPVLVCLPNAYGRWLHLLLNETQHIGLQDRTPDFRLCCRTILVNPFLRFLYWNMNYHTEHHMYAAVPCYNLGRLHRLIAHELPPCPRGLVATWRHIAGVLERQRLDPTYRYVAPVPFASIPQE